MEEESGNTVEDYKGQIGQFAERLEALRISLPITAELMETSAIAIERDYVEYLKTYCEAEEEEDAIKFRVPEDQLSNSFRYLKQLERLALAARILPTSFIVTLVSQFDILISQIIKYIYSVQPSFLNGSGRTFRFEELADYKTVDEFKASLIEKEVDATLRENHIKQINYIENKLGITLKSDPEIIARFIEITERRNLFVHCDGKVNQQYIQTCLQNGYKFPVNVKEGDILTVRPKYFYHAVDTILELGVKLSHIVWNKMAEDETEEVQSSLNTIAYELIVASNYSLSLKIINFGLTTFGKKLVDKNKLMLLINKAQALRWQEKKKESQEILNQIEWSALSPMYKLAKEVLEGNFEGASKIMYMIRETSELSKNEYREWPLFKEFRETDFFRKAYKEIYGEEYGTFKKVEPRSLHDVLKIEDLLKEPSA